MAAQKFGGKYSPQGRGSDDSRDGAVSVPPPPPRETLKPAGRWRATALFLLAFVFLFPAFRGTPDALIAGLGAGGLLILASWLSREGLMARAAFDARRIARRPAIPRILLGAVCTGLALGLGGMLAHGPSIYALAYALLGAGLHLGTFGLDPMRDKGMEGIDVFQTDRAARAIAEAEKTLAQMRDAILRARDRTLEARVDRFADHARALFRRIESDPGDLTAARRYLSVYLEGARDATSKFADLWAETRDPAARRQYEALLSDLETTFAQRSDVLLGNDRERFDIEMQVLQDRLRFETPLQREPTPPPSA